jgi:hypothetical protein
VIGLLATGCTAGNQSHKEKIFRFASTTSAILLPNEYWAQSVILTLYLGPMFRICLFLLYLTTLSLCLSGKLLLALASTFILDLGSRGTYNTYFSVSWLLTTLSIAQTIYIQGDPGGKANILGGHSIGHMYTCRIPNDFRDRAISLCSSKIVVTKDILRAVSNTGIYCSSDNIGTVYLIYS